MVSIAIIVGIAVKLYVSRVGGADISQAQLQERMEQKSDLCILDVRGENEYKSGHVPGAINIGHTEISAHLDRLRPYENKEVVVYCERGVRARMALNALTKAGFTNVYHLTGDMAAWRRAGLPTDTPGK
jgi:rhodanese-related sulfurtransferase